MSDPVWASQSLSQLLIGKRANSWGYVMACIVSASTFTNRSEAELQLLPASDGRTYVRRFLRFYLEAAVLNVCSSSSLQPAASYSVPSPRS